MKILWTESIGGIKHSRMSDGTYDPPLPAEEVARRESRLPAFREELLSGQVARGMTDDVAINGLDNMGAIAERDPKYAKRLAAKAARLGYKVKPTDCYNPMLAVTEGDPMAFLNHGQGRGHVKRVAAARNMTVQGIVNHEAHEPETDPFVPDHRLHPKIVRERKKQLIRDNPDLARMDQKELAANIIATHAPQ